MARRNARLIKRPQATRDIVEIAVFIARDSPRASSRFLNAVERTFAQLARVPRIGRVYPLDHPTLSDIRCFQVSGFASYLIFYRVVDGVVEVLRVIHGARDIPTLLAEEGR